MTARVQTQRFFTTGQRPPSGVRTSGELWLNLTDLSLGAIDQTLAPVDLLPVRTYSASAGYNANALVVNSGQLLQARATIPPKTFAAGDWNQFLTNAQGDARWLPLSGGIMTGLLTLSGPPTANLHASTKAYADTKLPLTGGVLTGALTVAGNGISYAQGSAHFYAFNWTGTRLQAFVDNINVGNFAIGDYLPLTGGTVSGNITATSFTVSTSGGYFAANAGASVLTWDGGGWNLQYNRANGTLAYLRGSDNANLWQVDGVGNSSIPGSFFAGLDLNAARNINATGTITGATVVATLSLYANNANIVLGPLGSGAYLQMTSGYYFQLDPATASMQWVGNNGIMWVMRAQDAVCFNNASYVAGHGAYHDLSDERMKTDITPATAGLPEILAITPINFHRIGPNGDTYTRDELGFSAQNVQPVLPEAVTEAGIALPDGSGGLDDPNPTLAVAGEVILAAVVNAIKTLDQRILALEAP